jgi:hypothetical protein
VAFSVIDGVNERRDLYVECLSAVLTLTLGSRGKWRGIQRVVSNYSGVAGTIIAMRRSQRHIAILYMIPVWVVSFGNGESPPSLGAKEKILNYRVNQFDGIFRGFSATQNPNESKLFSENDSYLEFSKLSESQQKWSLSSISSK